MLFLWAKWWLRLNDNVNLYGPSGMKIKSFDSEGFAAFKSGKIGVLILYAILIPKTTMNVIRNLEVSEIGMGVWDFHMDMDKGKQRKYKNEA